jgi:hypothetical protein
VGALAALVLLLHPAGALAKLAKPAKQATAVAKADTSSKAASPAPGAGAPTAFFEPDIGQSSDVPRRVRQAAQTLDQSEMLNLAKRYDREMAGALLEGERAKANAIRLRDALKLSCIQDRLANMKLMRRVSVDHLTALERQDVQSDDLHLRHEFLGVEMASERIGMLRQELSQCVGESLDVAYGAEHDQVPTTPASDPTGSTDITPIDRPPPASMFQ